jgi:glycerol-3-phosphate dehydrogenase
MDEDQQEKMIKAEVWFTVHYEMVNSPTDFFMRRTGRLFFDKPSVDSYKELVLTELKNYFGWDEKTTKNHQEELDKKLQLATTFK